MKTELKELNKKEFIKNIPSSLKYGPYEEDDFYMKIGNVYCCCNMHNAINNIVVYSLDYDLHNIDSLITFIYILKCKGIKYIRVSSIGKDRYKFLLNHYFPNYITEHNGNEWIHYVSIGE